jgi:hypothetical protein
MVNPFKVMNLKPFTPVRKLFLNLELFKPSNVLGKRRDRRDHDSGTENEQLSSTGNETTTAPRRELVRVQASQRPACLALQNEDHTEDVVVITTLNNIPFCCHEDLLTMSREQLLSAALTLNARLPAALKIDVSHRSPDALIRNSIELIVGLRSEVPPAPKAVKMHSDSGLYRMGINRSPPSSPLAMRTRSRDLCVSLEGPRLARLDEEDEDSMLVDRPAKRRRDSVIVPDITTPRCSLPEDIFCTPTPLHRKRLFRTQSHRVAPSGSPTLKRVLRSYSQKLSGETKSAKNVLNSTNVTFTRPRYRRKRKGSTTMANFQQSKCTTPSNINGSFSTVGELARQGSNSKSKREEVGSGMKISNFLPKSTLKQSTHLGSKRRRIDADEDDEMTNGLGGMTMAVSGSAMDVCEL